MLSNIVKNDAMSNSEGKSEKLIGFIGQGYIGKNYSDDLEKRGYNVVRYALEEPYVKNKESIADCDIVFIAVPTPSTVAGFDDSILRGVLPLIGDGATIVIKSTVLPGTTEALQEEFPDKTFLFSPEFLLEATAAHDAAYPILNIIGMPADSAVFRERAEEVMDILPEAKFAQICSAREAELFKYAHNIHGVFRVIFANLVYDIADIQGCSWEAISDAMEADPYFSSQANYYNRPVHKSGRGAGGHCFIKDLAAFREQYENVVGDRAGVDLLRSFERKNHELLRKSGKDLDILKDVYGDTM